MNATSLVWYALLLVGGTVWGCWLRQHVTRPRDWLPLERPLDLYEVAYLSGGPRRVADTALTRLVDHDALRVSRHGRVHATGRVVTDPTGQVDAVDAHLLALTAVPGGVPADRLVTCLAASPAVDFLGRWLVERGLAAPPADVRRARWLSTTPLHGLAAAMGLHLVLGVGAHRPGLAGLVLVTELFAVLLHQFPPGVATPLGQRVLHDVEEARRTGAAPPPQLAAAMAGAAGQVAVGGLAAHPDSPLRRALSRRGERAWAWCWPSSSSCSSS
ncbi:hypothetical protein GCM10012275_28000 [Longimycelium tulufanense]|uniref:TIGR04222 domain-containing membrane protein n=1 Tax=Longimycelium tulufanense TaxID=907463 RepID=A0A8J3CEM1_9PSEU|nr:TIGR04222 domain-containing membrane protein [Longimycelium tulufanense]GGM55258.1 hypothetical protein GCM10012275_28000 [Longimycelium tulufanense]